MAKAPRKPLRSRIIIHRAIRDPGIPAPSKKVGDDYLLAAYKGLPPLCNGKATGHQCKFYWQQIHPESEVADRDGNTIKRRRFCTVTCPGTPDELDDPHAGTMEGHTMPMLCGRYVPNRLRTYNPAFEEAIAGLRTGVGVGGVVAGDMDLSPESPTVQADLAAVMLRANAEKPNPAAGVGAGVAALVANLDPAARVPLPPFVETSTLTAVESATDPEDT
jgi:hypothetical protein